MEGYSVTEAASILGVPTERVWELLARGVLAGAAEGETGMRVYLQPRPAPAPPVAETARPNGDPGPREPERELSPFRELLTEFRNLTERYGQALLALGEARGEVAALRSRVDLLEARMDLRLPMGGGMPAPSPWPAPMPEPMPRPPAPERETTHQEDDESGGSAAGAADEDRPSRRRRSGRHATESFAEALARAQDPTRPELPGAAEAAAALAALRAQSSDERAMTDAALPRELPAAESMPAPDEAPAAQVAAEPAPEPDPAPMVMVGPDPDADEPRAAPQSEPVGDAESQPAPIAFDPERYTVEIEEPDWYVEDEPAVTDWPRADTSETSTQAPSIEELPTASPSAAEPAVEPEGDDREKAVEDPPAAEEAMLWFGSAPGTASADSDDSGADEMEVVGGSGGRPAGGVLPGSRELDEALAALDALAGRNPPGVPADEPPPGPAPVATETTPPTWAPEPRAAWPTADRTATPPSVPTTPASRAYRRLRRIFPG